MADIEGLRKAALPTTGLVPCKVLRPFMPYGAGQVVGFPPEVALSHINLGNVEEYKGSKADAQNPMLGFTGPEPGSGSSPKVPGPLTTATRTTKYDRRPEVSPKAQRAPTLPTDPPDEREPEVASIPDGWEDFDGASLRRLAADLSGRRYQELSADDARTIIQANIDGTQETEPAAYGYSGVVHGDPADNVLNGVVSTRSYAATQRSETDSKPRARQSSKGGRKAPSRRSSKKAQQQQPAPEGEG